MRVLHGLVLFALLSAWPAHADIKIPELKWNAAGRSDWIDVKTEPSLGAHPLGDGMADDTAALQAALDLASAPGAKRLTVYLPPGTYKITSTLYWHTPSPEKPWSGSGLWLVGCGRTTTILWAGDAGAPMFLDLGSTRTRYTGIVWNAGPSDKAAGFGVAHVSLTSYQSRMRHENEAFIGFRGIDGKGTIQVLSYKPVVPATKPPSYATTPASEAAPAAGIFSGLKLTVNPMAETMIWNCQFENDTIGAVLGLNIFNEYMWEFRNCDFQDCGIGISSLDGKAVVLDCHFQNSSVMDIQAGNGLTYHIRRCTSNGSKMFFATSQGGAMPCSVIEDCWIDGWTNKDSHGKTGAIRLCDHGPMMIFDCRFTHPPSADSPIIITNNKDWTYNLFVSNNVCPDIPALISTGTGGGATTLYTIPPGKLQGGITSLSTMPTIFLKSSWPPDSDHILDVTRPPYNVDNNDANNTAADATVGLQQAINDAKAANNGTIVYLPHGQYKLTAPLEVSGGNYTIEGTGLSTEIIWCGEPNGTMMNVTTPQKITLAQFSLKPPKVNASPSPTATSIMETAKGPSSLTIDGVYSSEYPPGNVGAGVYNTEGPGLVLSHLPAGSFVNLQHLDMPLTVNDCGPAEIFGNFVMIGRVIVSGATAPKTGFLGALIMEGGQNDTAADWDVDIRDNQDLVCSDYYSEQSYNNLILSGSANSGPGRVTIQSYKQNSEVDYPPHSKKLVTTTQIGVKDYHGQLFYGPATFVDFNPVRITQVGQSPFNLALVGDVFAGGDPAPTITTDSSCNLIELGDAWEILGPRGGGGSTAMPDMPNPATDETLGFLANGLDHLRQLDLEDLKVQGFSGD